jgi:hypothetical protein
MKSSPIAFFLALSALTGGTQAGTAFVSQQGGPLTVVSNAGSVADPFDLGILGAPFSSVFVTLSSTGSFSEYATFGIPTGFGGVEGASNTYALTVTPPVGLPVVVGSITDFAVTFLAGTPALPDSAPFGPYGAGTSFNLPDASAGTYFLHLTGVVQGIGGQYSAAIQVSPIPEPGSALLSLVGLGVLAWCAPRRRT